MIVISHRVRAFPIFLLLGASLWLGACSNLSTVRYEKIAKHYSKQNYAGSIAAIQKNQKLYGDNNRFLYHLDLGVLFHYLEQPDSSIRYLEKGVQDLDDLYAKSVTNEALSFLSNDNMRPYRSHPYEIVLLHQLLMQNYMAQGQWDEALVETRRTQLKFDEWSRRNKQGDRYTTDGLFHYLSSLAYQAAGERDNSLISLYHAVKAYQNGPVPLPRLVRNEAAWQFSLNGRESDTAELHLSPDLSRESISGLDPAAAEIIFIGLSGRAPVLAEEVYWGTYVHGGALLLYHSDPASGKVMAESFIAPLLPADELGKAEKGRKTNVGSTFHIKFSLPVMKPLPSRTDHFVLVADSQATPVRPERMTDLTALVKKNLDDTRTATLMRTVVRVVIRTIASQKAKNAAASAHPAANLAVSLITDLLGDQLEQADLRGCFLLPGNIQIARIPVSPGTHTLQAAARTASGEVIRSRLWENVKVRKGEKKVVFFPSLE